MNPTGPFYGRLIGQRLRLCHDSLDEELQTGTCVWADPSVVALSQEGAVYLYPWSAVVWVRVELDPEEAL